jgi:chemotaxis methyl-accepting protein methylase
MTEVAVDSGFAMLLEKIERERGFACASYKQNCLRRRIKTRMRVRQADTYDEYIGVLDRDAEEMDRLVDALTINVTRFFRNRPVWDLLALHVIPSLWSAQIDQIRVWSAGCATGEEPLSIAMLFHRHMAVNGMLSQVGRLHIVGTDVDEGVIKAAARACYSEADLEEIDPELRRRYFTETPPFQPRPGVQQLVDYVRHDLLSDPFPAVPQHLIMCRNVLIYFDRPTQQQVMERFRACLAPGGYLVLGKVESLLGASWGFERIAARERIFKKLR